MDRTNHSPAMHDISQAPYDAAVVDTEHPQRRGIFLDECVTPKAAPSLSGIFCACDRLKGEAQGLKDPDVWKKCRDEAYKFLITFDRRDKCDMDMTRCVTSNVHDLIDARIRNAVRMDGLRSPKVLTAAFQKLHTSLITPKSVLRKELTGLPLLVQIMSVGREVGESQQDYVVRLCCANSRIFKGNASDRPSYMVRLSPTRTDRGPTYHSVLFDRLLTHVVRAAAELSPPGSNQHRKLCQNGAGALSQAFPGMQSKNHMPALASGLLLPPETYRARRQSRVLACA